MFMTSLARQVRLARLSASLPGSAVSVAAAGAKQIQPTFAASALLRPTRLPSSLLSRAWRAYSSAAEARNEEPGSSAPGQITQFADLSKVGVHENLVKAIVQDMGYQNMTEVQSVTLGPALEGKDMVAQAKTGTGKTLAFLTPVLSRILSQDPDLASRQYRTQRGSNSLGSRIDIRAIVISPTRELAEQIAKEAEKLCANTGLKVALAVGGTRKRQSLQEMHRFGCNILVGTPGRLNDLLMDSSSGVVAPKISALILDEADRMLDVGFEKELRSIVETLPDRERQPRQTLLFSATIPDNVVNLARWYVDRKNFKFVQTVKEDEAPTHEKVPQFIVPVKRYENMLPAVIDLVTKQVEACQQDPLKDPFKAIIFFPFTTLTHMSARIMSQIGRDLPQIPEVYYIHSKLDQNQRTRAAENFRRAKSAILVSSDVTARGMDFPNVTHVIQYGLPPQREQYIHRLGRTGRADKAGEGWILVPEFAMNDARRMLGGFPIQRRADIESALLDKAPETLEDASPSYRAVAKQLRRIPENMLEETYMIHFGQAEKHLLPVLVQQLNEWTKNAWGWEEPPVLSPSLADRKGLARIPGVNIGTKRRSPSRNTEDELDFADYHHFGSNYGGDSGGSGGSGGFGSGSGGGFDRRGGGGGFDRRGGGGGGGFDRRAGGGGGFDRRGGGGGGFDRRGGGGGGFDRRGGGGGGFDRRGGGGGFDRRGGGGGGFDRRGGGGGFDRRGGGDSLGSF
ncbi:hypothetical protein RB597_006697 [Gaeumannomyces tritici]